MSELFEGSFRTALRGVLRRARQLRAPPESGDRARRRRIGLGGTFAGHRPYAAGEDVRLLDWNAFARTRALHVKVLEEEHRRALTILLDGSRSMAAGSPRRFDGARRLAAMLGAVALARLDVLTLVIGGRRVDLAGSHDFEPLLAALEAAQPDGTTADEAVQVWARSASAGRILWLSDFAKLDELARGLRLLGRARRRVLGVLPELDADRGSELDGLSELVDEEGGREEGDRRERIAIDGPLRAAFAEELRLHARRVEGAFKEAGIGFARQRVQAVVTAADWTKGGWLEWLR